MALNRYIYKSNLDIIAPFKCGTRWLNEFINECIYSTGLSTEELSFHIHSNSTFIWRPVREHFLSALQTDWALSPNKHIWDIITEMKSGHSGHWHPHLYKKLYPLWLKTSFKFYKLQALSELIPSTSKYKWTSNSYDFKLPIGHITVEEALKSLSPKQSIKIEKLISEEDGWLKLMLKSQYIEKTWEDFFDLEDVVLKMKCDIMDLEHKVTSLEDKVIELEDKVIELEDNVIVLTTKLKTKLNKTLI